MPDIARLRELLEKGTPGPWKSTSSADFVWVWPADGPGAVGHFFCKDFTENCEASTNAALICEAVNALPALLQAWDVVEAVKGLGLKDQCWCDDEVKKPCQACIVNAALAKLEERG